MNNFQKLETLLTKHTTNLPAVKIFRLTHIFIINKSCWCFPVLCCYASLCFIMKYSFYFVYRQKNLSQKKKLRKIVVKIDVLENSDPNQIVESVVKPEDAVSWVKEYEKLIRSKKQIVINTAYCQEHILQKFKKSKTFVEMVKDLIIR